MTGPLAQQFAQLATVLERAGRSDSTLGWDSPGGYCPCCEMADDCHTDDCEISLALAALSAIERHVQDMEKALRKIDKLDGRYADLNTARHMARAALPANPPQGDAAEGSSPSGGGWAK